MESLQIALKRKKRRTRKCLDKIRKRSRRNSQIFSSKQNECISKNNIQTKYITSERLTLSMFPKAIRSETITRPVLAELNQKLNLDDLVKGTKVLTTIRSFINNIENFSENNSSCNSDEYSNNNISNNPDKSSESFVHYSHLNSAKLEVRDKSLDRMGVSIRTPSLTQSLNDNCSYNLYEEFMSDLPKYLKHNTSAHREEDIMKKSKLFLHNLFIENCSQEYENNIINCFQSTSTKLTHKCKEIIVHNPADFLRLGHIQRQSLFYKINESLTECIGTPQSPDEPGASSSPCSFIRYDTPEYTFYPHRLN